MTQTPEERLVDLEIRLAYQDEAIRALEEAERARVLEFIKLQEELKLIKELLKKAISS